jgi:hypothetical protein
MPPDNPANSLIRRWEAELNAHNTAGGRSCRGCRVLLLTHISDSMGRIP